jgi:hypothetical protein
MQVNGCIGAKSHRTLAGYRQRTQGRVVHNKDGIPAPVGKRSRYHEGLRDKDWKAPKWGVMTMRGKWTAGEKKAVKK